MSVLFNAVDYTTDELIVNIKDTITVPNSQNLFDPNKILKFANREMATVVVPFLMTLKAYYLVETHDYTITTDTEYVIPATATAMKLMDVCYVDNQGIENKMPLLTHDQVASNQWTINMVPGFFIKNNVVKIYPYPIQGFSLRFYFYRRPNQLVQTNEAGQVTAIAGNVLTMTRIPSTWTTSDNICAISQEPGFDARFNSRAITSIVGTSLTVSDATDIQLGDWICIENESTIPQIPPEAHPYLAQAVGTKMLLSVGAPNATDAQKMLDIMKSQLTDMMTPRSDDTPKKIRNVNSPLNWLRTRNKWTWW